MQAEGIGSSTTDARQAEFRQFAEHVISPRAAEFDRRQEVPADVLQALAHRGYLGAAIGAEYGGSGMSMVTLGVLHEEVGRACSSVRSILTVQGIVASAIQRWGSPAHRASWLPRLASGEIVGALALTEERAGSDPSRLETVAEPGPGGYVLSGVKRWITAAQIAGLLLVLARTPGGISAFLVPRDTPGLQVVPVTEVLGTRASLLGEVRLDRCRLPADAIVGPADLGFATVGTTALEFGRYSVACGCVGIAQGCLDACLDHTEQRWQGGAYLKDHQLVRRLLTDVVTETAAARLLCWQAGALRDANDPAGILATWMAKYFACAIAGSAASAAVRIHGAAGCAGDHPAGRYFRDAKIMEIIEGSTEVQQVVIAEFARWERNRLPHLPDVLRQAGATPSPEP